MDKSVISVERLSKRYPLSHFSAKDGLRHRLEAFIRAPWQWLKQRHLAAQEQTEEYWALQDVDFKIGHGEVVGVIGRNGAGKSTLLKIISRITPPSSGQIRLRGRV